MENRCRSVKQNQLFEREENNPIQNFSFAKNNQKNSLQGKKCPAGKGERIRLGWV
jgi:hypothetical protein